jgi:hypothetical protein
VLWTSIAVRSPPPAITVIITGVLLSGHKMQISPFVSRRGAEDLIEETLQVTVVPWPREVTFDIIGEGARESGAHLCGPLATRDAEL